MKSVMFDSLSDIAIQFNPQAGKIVAHSPESVDEELFRDVVLAVGVLEGEVELVVAVQHPEAVLGLRPRAPLRPAAPVNVNLKNIESG